jgi:hypothetical protein
MFSCATGGRKGRESSVLFHGRWTMGALDRKTVGSRHERIPKT